LSFSGGTQNLGSNISFTGSLGNIPTSLLNSGTGANSKTIWGGNGFWDSVQTFLAAGYGLLWIGDTLKVDTTKVPSLWALSDTASSIRNSIPTKFTWAVTGLSSHTDSLRFQNGYGFIFTDTGNVVTGAVDSTKLATINYTARTYQPILTFNNGTSFSFSKVGNTVTGNVSQDVDAGATPTWTGANFYGDVLAQDYYFIDNTGYLYWNVVGDGTNNNTLQVNPYPTGWGGFVHDSPIQIYLPDFVSLTGFTTANLAYIDGGSTFTNATWNAAIIDSQYVYAVSNIVNTWGLTLGWYNHTAGLGVDSTILATLYNLSNTFTGSTHIVTLGTVTGGTWHGTAVDSAYAANIVSYLLAGKGITLSTYGKTWKVSNDTTVMATLYNLSNTFAGSANIVTLGTITSGTWHGTAIDSVYTANVVSNIIAGYGELVSGFGKTKKVGNDTTVMSTHSYVNQQIAAVDTSAFWQFATPSGISSTTWKMLGLGKIASYTTNVDSVVTFTIYGNMQNTTTADGVACQLAYGTGTPPNNGAAATGTVVGSYNYMASSPGGYQMFTIIVKIKHLAPGTYWFDLQAETTTAGTAIFANITATCAEEVK
jgi:hypothetical protein